MLLVEDDRQVRDLLVLLLRGRGYAVQQAASGAEAEALSRRFRPDILVADVDLRGSPSGPALYGRLRCRYPGLKVLFISGYPREHLMRFGMDPGASRLLVKPFTADSLASTVTEVLAQP